MYQFKGLIGNLNKDNLIITKENEIKDEFILVNPNDIKAFCLTKPKLIDLINISSSLIRNFFPNSKIYLEYKEDPEYDDFDAIFAYIVNKNSIEENNKIYNELLDEFIHLKKVFPKLYSYYYINVQNDDEILRKYKINK